MTWASYIRVSDDKQSGDDRFGFPRQRREILTYLKPHQESNPLEFKDVISGTKESRDDFEKLLEAAKQRRITRVCISEYDRLGRNLFTSFALMGEMVRAGLEVHSALDGVFDPNSSKSRQEFARRSSEADSELERITRRMYGGKLEKARGGKPINPLNAYGWTKGVICEHEKSVLEWACREALHRGLVPICEELNARGEKPPARGVKWHHSTLRQMLRNPMYVGQYHFGRKTERITVEVPALLDLELWHTVQAALNARTRNTRPGKRLDYELTGRIFCSVCGSVMSGFQPSKKAYSYYFCRKTLRINGKACNHKTYYRATDLHEAVTSSLKNLLLSPETLEGSLARPAPPKDTTADRKRLTDRLARARAAYLNGIDTLEEYTIEKQKLELAIQSIQLEPAPAPPRDAKRTHQILKDAFASHSSLREIAKAFILTVRVGFEGEVKLEIGA